MRHSGQRLPCKPAAGPSTRSLFGAFLALLLCAAGNVQANDLSLTFLRQSPDNTVPAEIPITYTIQTQNVDDEINDPSAIGVGIRIQVNGTTVRADSGEFTSDGCIVDPDFPSDFACFDLVEGASQTPSFTWNNPQPGTSEVIVIGSCQLVPEQEPPVFCPSFGISVGTTRLQTLKWILIGRNPYLSAFRE